MNKQQVFLMRLATVVVVLIMAVLGLVLGMWLRDRVNPPIAQEAALTPPPRLTPGQPFPDVQLVAEDGSTTTTHQILAGRGGVVLFLEVGCAPCSLMVSAWKSRLADPALADVPVFGIGSESGESLRRYKQGIGFGFPVFTDPVAAFERDYEVTRRPLQLTVGRSLAVRSFTFDGREAPDPASLKRLLAQ